MMITQPHVVHGAVRMTLRRLWTSGVVALIAASILFTTGCSSPLERRALDEWTRADRVVYSSRHAKRDSMAESADDEQADRQLPEDAALDDYIRYAMRHNPTLQAVFYRWRAAIERIAQARTLPDPQASFGLVLDQVDRSAQYMGERYALSQMFPWFGKLERLGDMALEEAHAEAKRFETARLQLIDEVSRAYFEYAYLQQAVAIAHENRELLARLESVTRTMFRAGTVSLADVNRAQIELGRLDDQVRSFEDILGPARADLNATLGRAAHARLPSVPVRPSEQTGVDLQDYSDDQWLSLARQHNPEIAATRHEASRQRQAIALARKDYYPDMMVEIEYARDGSARMAMMDGGGSDMLMGMVSISLPIWRDKYHAGVREAMAKFGEATRQIQSREHRLEADLKRALYTYRNSSRKLHLYGGTLLPKARQSLASVEAAYRAGDAGFSDLVDAQRLLLEFALAHERAAADRAQAFARIQALVGDASAGEPAASVQVQTVDDPEK